MYIVFFLFLSTPDLHKWIVVEMEQGTWNEEQGVKREEQFQLIATHRKIQLQEN